MPRLLWLVAASIVFAACSSGTGGGSERLAVVATTAVVADLARGVGGDRISLTTIVEAGADTHHYEPTAQDLRAIRNADVVVRNGVGLEEWYDAAVGAASPKGRQVDLSEGTVLRQVGERSSEHGGADPHIWLNIANARRMVANISNAFLAADPTSAARFQEGAKRLDDQLVALDGEIRGVLGPLGVRRIVTVHDSFGYFADAYGIEVSGVVHASVDDNAEPSAAELGQLIERIKTAGVRAVFADAGEANDEAKSVADRAGVKFVAGADALYTDGLGPAGSPAATYTGMMRHNAQAIAKALA